MLHVFHVVLYIDESKCFACTDYVRPIKYGRQLYFCPVVFSSSSTFRFFPHLISVVADWMFTILLHMVWP